MKVKYGIVCVTISMLSIGCATTSTQQIQESQQLKARIVQLESEIQKREEQKNQLEAQLEETRRSKENIERKLGYVSAGGTIKDFESPNAIKKIQTALKNAGYEVGPIDGKMGRKTKEAIKDFQRENGLTADGIVGQKTWAKLNKYLTEE
ncbi:MAG: hypothetical protein FJZ16_03705 [Candidatus Omnitrophica bacterium]|nr:hypothetical protein [Candidatus Omnitrophota bacterium]